MENVLLNIIDDFLGIEEEQKETWSVTTDLDADWCLDKIREVKAEYNRYEIVINDKIQQLQFKLSKERQKMEHEVSFFESKLREYFGTVKTKDTKTTKKYKLPSGELKAKKEQLVIDYDREKLLEYAEKEDLKELIKITKDFKWGDFKKNLSVKSETIPNLETGEFIEHNYIINKETGEILEIEGLSIKIKPEEFSVEV